MGVLPDSLFMGGPRLPASANTPAERNEAGHGESVDCSLCPALFGLLLTLRRESVAPAGRLRSSETVTATYVE
ncbi:hypothetical protein JCM6292_1651 [Bacteroides pyogenes JCM 6292]|uniref:Uncharacterized protein n=2 Tax=Bacteroides pyogenes TaxID=310300 RepID=W4PGZ9_9BACE|nr:hypothetical protein JCM6292_1651 [Bacteroides pyogenes JCM 6292]GAE18955.1 hypothetical protein JCM6294_1938 [Bacteroides pyogenes DSM 20611 = JCM 6294]